MGGFHVGGEGYEPSLQGWGTAWSGISTHASELDGEGWCSDGGEVLGCSWFLARLTRLLSCRMVVQGGEVLAWRMSRGQGACRGL